MFFSGSPELILSPTGLTRAVCGAGEGLGAPGPVALAVGWASSLQTCRTMFGFEQSNPVFEHTATAHKSFSQCSNDPL